MVPTQDLPPNYDEKSNPYGFTAESFATREHRIGMSPYLFPIDRWAAVDIDVEIDFAVADGLMRRRVGLGCFNDEV